MWMTKRLTMRMTRVSKKLSPNSIVHMIWENGIYWSLLYTVFAVNIQEINRVKGALRCFLVTNFSTFSVTNTHHATRPGKHVECIPLHIKYFQTQVLNISKIALWNQRQELLTQLHVCHPACAQCKQKRDPLVKTLLQSTTSGEKTGNLLIVFILTGNDTICAKAIKWWL